MRLLFDLGNSRLKWALAEDGKLVEKGVILYDSSLPSKLRSVIQGAENNLGTALVASVVSSETYDAFVSILNAEGLKSEEIQPQLTAYGVVNGYHEPSALGVDRWVSLIAARHLFEGAVVIVDAGTAVKVDGLTGNGEFIGGMILPGRQMYAEGLTRGAAGISVDELPHILSNEPGRSTAGCLAAGFACSIQGAVDCMVSHMTQSGDSSPTALLTGGDAERIAKSIGMSYRQAPDLVLQGLAFIGNTLT